MLCVACDEWRVTCDAGRNNAATMRVAAAVPAVGSFDHKVGCRLLLPSCPCTPLPALSLGVSSPSPRSHLTPTLAPAPTIRLHKPASSLAPACTTLSSHKQLLPNAAAFVYIMYCCNYAVVAADDVGDNAMTICLKLDAVQRLLDSAMYHRWQ